MITNEGLIKIIDFGLSFKAESF